MFKKSPGFIKHELPSYLRSRNGGIWVLFTEWEPIGCLKCYFIISDLYLDRGSIPSTGKRMFPLASMSTPALGPTQPGVLSPGLKHDWGVTLTTHPHPVPRSRLSSSYISSPLSASMVCSGTALAFLSSIQPSGLFP
jgi:hypothetical protein